MRRYIILLVLAISVCAVSCRKEPLDKVNPNNRVKACRTYLQQFLTVWEGMDQGYVFWDKDSIDWDERYDKYRPVFEAFDSRPANNPVTHREYAEAWNGLFEGLLDHHLTGRFYSAKGKFEAKVSPGRNTYEHSTTSTRERDIQLGILQRKAIPGTFIGCEPFTYGKYEFPGSWFCLLKGANDGELIAYFRFTSFYMTQMYRLYSTYSNIPNSHTAQAAAKKFYGPQYYRGATKEAGYVNNDSVVGIIIDLRGNYGGSVADLEPLIGSLSQSSTLIGYTRVKEGFGRLDYSAWSKSIVDCPDLHMNKPKPVVVLSDVSSVSCAELSTMLIKNLPYGKFIGERTYGAIGGLYSGESTNVFHDLFYDGCFGDYSYFEDGPNIYSDVFSFYVYTSTFHMVDKDFNDIEGFGVKPDIEVLYSARLLESGVDNQLERALVYLRTGR